MMRLRLFVLAVAVSVIAGCGDRTQVGIDAWNAGRFDDARAAFDREVEAAGEDASAELLYDRALATLQVGRWTAADTAAQRAQAAGLVGAGAFVRGNAAFALSEAIEVEARRPGADPTLMQRTIAFAEDALAQWRVAAASRHDWPEARRNVERALLRLDDLREKKQTGDGTPRERPGPPPPGGDRPPGARPPPPPPAPDDPGAEPDPTLESGDLPAGRVLGLFELLREKERQKRAMRRAERRVRGASAERDW